MTVEPTNARRRARLRMAADNAHGWARNLTLKNPYAKSLLRAICLYVDDEGVAFASIDTLADDTDLSADTVRRRLRWLEDIGAIARFPRWIDENGRVNSDGRGKRTTDSIKLLYDTDPDEIERKARDGVDQDHPAAETSPSHQQGLTDTKAAISPSHQQGLNDGQDSASPAPALAQPSHCGEGLNEEGEEEKKEPTPNPLPKQEGGVSSHARGERKEPDRLSEFTDAYPIPITDYAKTETIWKALSESERSDAILGAKGYATFCRENPKRAEQDAHRWLRDRKWLGYLKAGRQAESLTSRFEVREGTEHWAAWEIYFRCCNTTMPDFLLTGPRGERKFNAPQEWPPVGRGLNPDRSTWNTHHEGTGQFAAWVRRLSEIGTPVGTPSVFVGGKYLRSITVPCEWPPRKDGTGPPGEISDQDANEFLKHA